MTICATKEMASRIEKIIDADKGIAAVIRQRDYKGIEERKYIWSINPTSSYRLVLSVSVSDKTNVKKASSAIFAISDCYPERHSVYKGMERVFSADELRRMRISRPSHSRNQFNVLLNLDENIMLVGTIYMVRTFSLR